MIKKFMKRFLKFIIYSLYSKIILSELKLRDLLFQKEELIYSSSFGFGDFIVFCANLINKLNNKKKILCYSINQLEVASFFFNKNKINKTVLKLPKYLNETYLGNNFLEKSKYFRPRFIKNYLAKKNVGLSDVFYGNKTIIKYIKNKLQKNKINKNLKDIFKKKTISIFIKHYSDKIEFSNYGRRQTADLLKIYKIINFLINKNFNVLILGTKFDKFTNLCKLNYKKNIKNIFFLNEISKNYSVQDQVFVALNSEGYIGSCSGANCFFHLLNKNIINIDCTYVKTHKMFKKNTRWLYKKIKILNKFKKLYQYKNYNLNSIKNNLLENSYNEIFKKVLLVFKIK
jgi:hypothetical protein